MITIRWVTNHKLSLKKTNRSTNQKKSLFSNWFQRSFITWNNTSVVTCLSKSQYMTAWHQSALNHLHIICWKHSTTTIWSIANPPTLINLFYLCDDVIRVKGYFCVISFKNTRTMLTLKSTFHCEEIFFFSTGTY